MPINSSLIMGSRKKVAIKPQPPLVISKSLKVVALKISVLSLWRVMLLPALQTAKSLAAQNAATFTGATSLMFSIQHVLTPQFTNTLNFAKRKLLKSVAVKTSASCHSPTTTLKSGRAKTKIAGLSLKATWTWIESLSTAKSAGTSLLAFVSKVANTPVTGLGLLAGTDGNHQKTCAAATNPTKI